MHPFRRLAVTIVLMTAGVACESEPVEQAPKGDIKLPMELTTAKRSASARDDTLQHWLLNNTERFYGSRISDSAFEIIARGIGDKRVVMLGEHDGAIAQHALLKTSIVRALHEKEDFNVLAIEAPIWQCAPGLNPSLSYDWNALQRNCARDDWNNAEISELFRYVESTQRSVKPLVIVGLDAGTTGEVIARSSLAPLVARIDRKYASRVRMLDSVFTQLVMQGHDQPVGPRKPIPFSIASQFDSLSDWFTRASQAAQLNDVAAARFALASASARTSAHVARAFASFGSFRSKVSEFTDDILAENLAFVADTLYPSQKVIVWSRNTRIIRNQQTTEKYEKWTPSMASQFERLNPTNIPYSIALFGVNGNELREQRSRALPPPHPGSIAQLLYDKMGRTVLLTSSVDAASNGAQLRRGQGTAGRYDPMRTRLQAMDNYDAVLVVSNVSAATPVPK